MDGIMSSKLFATRQGTIIVGVAAAVIAAVALIVYLHQYRNSVNNNATTPVLVAKQPIQAGTPGSVLLSNAGYYRVSHVAKSSLQTGAFVDPSTLAGKVATTDIGQGEQLTAADFGPASGSVDEQLGPNQRAVVIPLGAPQQVGGQIGAGSHVDIWISTGGSTRPTVEELFQNVYVLGASGGNVTLRVSPQQAGQMIFASQNAQIWLDLRPTVASPQNTHPVTGLRAGG